jgi:hypothetical protein
MNSKPPEHPQSPEARWQQIEADVARRWEENVLGPLAHRLQALDA